MIIISPKEAIELIKKAIAVNAWGKNLEAIKEARNLVLNEYQLFPGIVNHIKTQEIKEPVRRQLQIPKAIIPKQSMYDKFISFLIRKF